MVPAPAQFLVQERDGVAYVAKGNADRYSAFVRFASGIDTGGAVALYLRIMAEYLVGFVERKVRSR